jgi:hypothetical protein
MGKRCFRCGNEIPEGREIVRYGKAYCSLEHASIRGTGDATSVSRQPQPTFPGRAEKPRPASPQREPDHPSSSASHTSPAEVRNQPKPGDPQH